MSEIQHIKVDLKASDFPELGLPTKVKSAQEVKDAGLKLSAESEQLRKDMENTLSRKALSIINSTPLMDGTGFEFSPDRVRFEFDLKKDVSNTYYFMGMTIDSDYDAVVKLTGGSLVVGSMFDPAKVINVPESYNISGANVHSEDRQKAEAIVKKLPASAVRKFSTAMKSGLIYDVYTEGQKHIDDAGLMKGSDPAYGVSDLLPMVRFMDDCITEAATGRVGDSMFKSLTLALAKEEENALREISGMTSHQYNEASLVVAMLFNYWSYLADVYQGYWSAAALIDYWSGLCSNALDRGKFQQALHSSIKACDPATGAALPDTPIVSFAGTRGTGSIPTLVACVNNSMLFMSEFSKVLTGEEDTATVETVGLMHGFLPTKYNYTNLDKVSHEELQALMSYDSLQYANEDADACMDSYDMSDEDERAAFLQAALKSYERNFKDYKPQNDYDVTEALAERIEGGDRMHAQLISFEDPGQAENLNEPFPKMEVSLTYDEIGQRENLSLLARALKITNATLKDVVAMF